MSIGTRIKDARIAKKLTQPQLAELIGVSKGAIGNYEADKSSPEDDILYRLIKVLDVDANYIFQDEIEISKPSVLLPKEADIIKKYRALDEHGIEMVNMVVDAEHRRCTGQPNIQLRAARGGGLNTEPLPDNLVLNDDTSDLDS